MPHLRAVAWLLLGRSVAVPPAPGEFQWLGQARDDFPTAGGLNAQDMDAGAWLQTVERFLLVDVSGLGESGASSSTGLHEGEDVVAALDYLDFSIEYLAPEAGGGNETAVALAAFAARPRRRGFVRRRPGAGALRHTICVLPLSATQNDDLARAVLAATVASLDGVFGRVVVTVATPLDEAVARDVQKRGPTPFEILTVAAEEEALLPRASLAGLQRSLLGEDAERWLGSAAGQYKYVYYTEHGGVLHVRKPRAVRNALDAGPTSTIVVPHRLPFISAPADDSSVALVDSDSSCLDTGEHPGTSYLCPGAWYKCAGAADYGLMQLRYGTGLPVLRGNDQGRQCVVAGDAPAHHRKRNWHQH
ncbi:hypothetical protein M885DRAFT_563577 [Pelagophyceae sp. CCMP2097]|nr:hypothetical protein M885DRAFT_563577 [Pelagophyceae sp. CCMP2097]